MGLANNCLGKLTIQVSQLSFHDYYNIQGLGKGRKQRCGAATLLKTPGLPIVAAPESTLLSTGPNTI